MAVASRVVDVAPVRLLVAVLVLGLLARAGAAAWSRRDLALDVWRGIRPHHVLGSVVLLVAVVGVSVAAASAVPLLGRGLGDLVATTGNAVFVPVDVAVEATRGADPPPAGGPDVVLAAAVTLFLGLLALLLPWFAFVEEEVFRAGAEAWSLPVRLLAALVFGAAHLLMLVPLAAALGIAVAGFVYGEVYRHGVAGRAGAAPDSLRRAFRPTRRSSAAAAALAPDPGTTRPHVRSQVDGLHASTVWHTTFNTTVVTLVWLTLVGDALTG